MKSIGAILHELTGSEITVILKNMDVVKAFVMTERLVKLQDFEYKPNHVGCYLCSKLFEKKVDNIDMNNILRIFDKKNKKVFCKEEYTEYIKREKNKKMI
jgi:hypothetical protein